MAALPNALSAAAIALMIEGAMKKSAFIVSLMAAFWGMLAVGACAGIGRDVWHYKMTVTIATPEGDKTGSSVREVTGSHNLKLTPESCGYCVGLAKGEAVVIDLGKRGMVFALLSGGQSGVDYGHQIFFQTFPKGEGNGTVILQPQDYPMFVKFKSLNNPMTVEALSATAKDDQLYPDKVSRVFTFENALGKGVYLKSVSVEITKDQVSEIIDQYLPWLINIHGDYLTGKETSAGSPYGLFGLSFKRGK